MLIKTINPIKLIATLIVFCFIAEQLVYAAPMSSNVLADTFSNAPFSHNQTHLPFNLPKHIATLDEVYEAPESTKKIILIQDAHTNASAQLNIAKTLDLIIQKQSIEHIFLEAGSGDLSLSSLREWTSKQKRAEIGLKYIHRGLLQGSEYLDLVSEHNIQLWGVEHRALYDKGLSIYRDVFTQRSEVRKYLDNIASSLITLKAELYNPNQIALDRLQKAHSNNETTFMQYLKQLHSMSKMQGVPTFKYKDLNQLIQLQNEEANIDFDLANQELESLRLLRSARNNTDRPVIANKDTSVSVGKRESVFVNEEELVIVGKEESVTESEGTSVFANEGASVIASGSEAISDFNTLPETHTLNQFNPMYINGMFDLADDVLDQKKYPNLARYKHYVSKTKNININKVLIQIKDLETTLWERNSQNHNQKDLHSIDESIEVLKQLNDLTLSPEQYEVIQSNPQAYDLKHISGFINQKILELQKYHNKAIALNQNIDLDIAKSFYDLTRERDESILINTLNKMDADNVDQAILIAGGFHVPNLKRQLKGQNISYMVITPVITHATNHAHYEELLLGQQTATQTISTKPIQQNSLMSLLQVRSPGSRLSLEELSHSLLDSPKSMSPDNSNIKPSASRLSQTKRILNRVFSKPSTRIWLSALILFTLISFSIINIEPRSIYIVGGSHFGVFLFVLGNSWLRLMQALNIESLLDDNGFPLLSELSEQELSQLEDWLKSSKNYSKDSAILLNDGSQFAVELAFDFLKKISKEALVLNLSNPLLKDAFIDKLYNLVGPYLGSTPEGITLEPAAFTRSLQDFNAALEVSIEQQRNSPRMSKIITKVSLTKWLAKKIWVAAGRNFNSELGQEQEWARAEQLLGRGWQTLLDGKDAVVRVAESISLARGFGKRPAYDPLNYDKDGLAATQIVQSVLKYVDTQIRIQIGRSRKVAESAQGVTMVNSLDLEGLSAANALLSSMGFDYRHQQEGGDLYGGDWFRISLDGEWGLIEIADGEGNGLKSTPAWILQKVINNYEIKQGKPLIRLVAEATDGADRALAFTNYLNFVNSSINNYSEDEVGRGAGTFTYGFTLVNFKTGAVHNFSAGHPPLVGRFDSQTWLESNDHDRGTTVIGLLPDIGYSKHLISALEESAKPIAPMDMFLLMSDGVTEHHGKMIGEAVKKQLAPMSAVLTSQFKEGQLDVNTVQWHALTKYMHELSAQIIREDTTDVTWVALNLVQVQQFYEDAQKFVPKPNLLSQQSSPKNINDNPRMALESSRITDEEESEEDMPFEGAGQRRRSLTSRVEAWLAAKDYELVYAAGDYFGEVRVKLVKVEDASSEQRLVYSIQPINLFVREDRKLVFQELLPIANFNNRIGNMKIENSLGIVILHSTHIKDVDNILDAIRISVLQDSTGIKTIRHNNSGLADKLTRWKKTFVKTASLMADELEVRLIGTASPTRANLPEAIIRENYRRPYVSSNWRRDVITYWENANVDLIDWANQEMQVYQGSRLAPSIDLVSRLLDFSNEEIQRDYRKSLAVLAYGLYKANRFDLGQGMIVGKSWIMPTVSYDASGNEVLNLSGFSIRLDEAATIFRDERQLETELRQKYIDGSAVASVLANREEARQHATFVKKGAYANSDIEKGILIHESIFDSGMDIVALEQKLQLVILNLIQVHKSNPEVSFYLGSGFVKYTDLIQGLLIQFKANNFISLDEPQETLVASIGSLGRQSLGKLHIDINAIQANDIPHNFSASIYQALRGLNVFHNAQINSLDFTVYDEYEVTRLRERYNRYADTPINDNQTFVTLMSGNASMALRKKHAWTIAQAIPIEYTLRAMQRTIQAVSTSQ